MKRNHLIISIGIVGVLVGAGYWQSAHKKKPLMEMANTSTDLSSLAGHVAGAPVPSTMPGMMDYRSTKLHFSLLYPADLGEVTDTDEGADAHTIVFDDGKPKGESKSFQIFVTPYAENQISSSSQRFLLDEPSGVINEAHTERVAGVSALVFYGYSDEIGDTQEVWFARDGLLYEVTTYKPLGGWLLEILKQWQFL